MFKVLHVVTTCDPKSGGPIEGVKQFYHWYQKNNIKCSLITLDKHGEIFLNDKRLPKTIALGPKYLNFSYSFKLKTWLIKNIKCYNAIIVHGLWQYNSFCVWQVAKKYNIPYYVFPHGMLDPWFKKKYPLKHLKKLIYWALIQLWVLKDAKAVLFTSIQEKILARKTFPFYNINEKSIGYGIYGSIYKLNKKKNSFLKKFPTLKDKKIILYLGRIHEKKGIDNLIKAFQNIIKLDNKLHLVISGPTQNNYKNNLIEYCKKEYLTNKITFTEALFDKIKWDAYHSSKFYCLPSHQENFGITIAEALSCKIPVITTFNVNIWKEIKMYKAGFISQNNAEDLEKKLKKAVKLNTKEYNKLKKNSYNCFKKFFYSKNSTKNLLKLIKNDN